MNTSTRLCFLLLFMIPLMAVGQRERLQTPNPFREFSLVEKKMLDSSEYNSLSKIYPVLDSVNFYDVTFTTIGRDFTGYYIAPKDGSTLPVILYNLGEDVEQLHFDHANAMEVVTRYAPRGHAIFISDYYDPVNPPNFNNSACREVNAVTNLIEHLHLFPETDSSKVVIREMPGLD